MDPAVRASDDDRQRVVAVLEQHTAAGRLQLHEFDERVKAALAAVTLGDLFNLTRDLPADTAGRSRGGDSLDELPRQSGDVTSGRPLAIAFALAALTLVVLGAILAVSR